jgi:hypothetical protein
MKHQGQLLAAAFALLLPTAALGQGTVVFANYGGGVNAPVRFTCGGFVEPTNYWVTPTGTFPVSYVADLYVGPAGATDRSAFTPLGLRIPFKRQGYFLGGTQTIPWKAPFETVALMVGVLETNLWNDLAGLSQPIDVRLGGGMYFPAPLAGLQPFGAGPLSCWPEPSSVSVFTLGGLLLGRRWRRRT